LKCSKVGRDRKWNVNRQGGHRGGRAGGWGERESDRIQIVEILFAGEKKPKAKG